MAVGSMRLTWRLLDEERSPIVSTWRFRHVDRPDDASLGIGLKHLENDRAFVPFARGHVRQQVCYIVSCQAVVVIAEAAADKDGLDPVFEREPVGELAVDEGARRENPPERARRLDVL